MAILLVEQYLDFCRELADDFDIMDRGAGGRCRRDGRRARCAPMFDAISRSDRDASAAARPACRQRAARGVDVAFSHRRAWPHALERLYQSRLRCARVSRDMKAAICVAALVNVGGGLVGGDRLRLA